MLTLVRKYIKLLILHSANSTCFTTRPIHAPNGTQLPGKEINLHTLLAYGCSTDCDAGLTVKQHDGPWVVYILMITNNHWSVCNCH